MFHKHFTGRKFQAPKFSLKDRVFNHAWTIARTNKAWADYANELQYELNEQNARRWGFCYLTGKRIDF